MLYKPFVKIFIILFSIFLSAIHAFAEDVTIQPQSDILYVKPYTDAYAIINIRLGGRGYIYANPKGEGTGKPLVAKATTHDPIELSCTRYLPGTMHISPIDNKPVYIYKNQKHYSGQILFDQKSYPFSISQADGVQGLKDLCYQYGRFLFCSPKLEKHFFDVLEGLNPEAKREKINFNFQQYSIITNKKIKIKVLMKDDNVK